MILLYFMILQGLFGLISFYMVPTLIVKLPGEVLLHAPAFSGLL